MNKLPFPDEIVRKIYQYINPIFEYEKYNNALKFHDELWYSRKLLIHASKQMYNPAIKYNYNVEIHEKTILMNKHLKTIKNFIRTNPHFRRPHNMDDLTYGKHKTSWEYEYNKNRLPRLESQILHYRSERCLDENSSNYNVMICHNLIYWLKRCKIKDIEYSCLQNNITFQEIKSKNMCDIEYKNSLLKLLINL